MPKFGDQLDPVATCITCRYPTVEHFLASKLLAHPQLLSQAEKEALSIVDDHIRACWAPREQSGLELLDEVKHKQRILPTGCDSLDILLGGGLREGHYTEVVGESSTGKSQLCMQVAVTAALRDEDVIYLDLSNSFSAERAAQLCQAHALLGAQVDLMAILSHITVIKAHSIHDTMNALDAVFIHMERSQQSQALPHEQRTQGGGPAGPGPGGSRSAGLPGGSRSAGPGPGASAACFSLLVVDSVSSVVAPVLGGRQRQQGHTLMMCLGRMLRHSACHYNLAVLGSNHMVSAGGFKGGREVEDDGDVQPGAGGYRSSARGMCSELKPALGELWRNQCSFQLQLAQHAGSIKSATLSRTPLSVVGQQVLFDITPHGLMGIQQQPT